MRDFIARQTGTTVRHEFHPAYRSKVLCTDGVKEVSQKFGVWWVAEDAVTRARTDARLKECDNLIFRLHRDERTLKVYNMDEEEVASFAYQMVNCPVEVYELWLMCEDDIWILLLPSEY